LLASLMHPNIAAIHDVVLEAGSSDPPYIVMELVAGETLEARLARGPMALDEARSVFCQVASALEAAHAKGIIHRDLKPANIQLVPSGGVKVLDFGLAKPLPSPVRPEDTKKTQTFDHLSQGLILGTPAYMSPEQARAKTVGSQADVWSFGCCLYESLTGRPAFDGETIPDVLAAVLSQDPDYSSLPDDTPETIQRLIQKTLRKDPRRRMRDMGDVRIELEDSSASFPDSDGVGTGSSSMRAASGLRGRDAASPIPLVAGVGAVLLLVAVSFLLGGRLLGPGAASPTDGGDALRRFVVDLPPTAPMSLELGAPIAFSPDGEKFAYGAGGEHAQIFVRNLGELEPIAVPGTQGGAQPFFSPDGEWLGFHADGKLVKVALGGGAPVVLADSPSPRGSVWLPSGDIIFAPKPTGGLLSVPSAGGPIQVFTDPVDPGIGDRWPELAAEWVIFSRWSIGSPSIRAVSPSGSSEHEVVPSGDFPRVAGPSHLLFVRNGHLFASVFDPRPGEVRGEPVMLMEAVSNGPLGVFAGDVSILGDLVYALPDVGVSRASMAHLLWVTADGEARRLDAGTRGFQLPRLSPDEKSVVVTIQSSEQTDIWIRDLERGAMSRLTKDGSSGAPIWSPDGRKITYSSDFGGAFNLYQRAADGSGDPSRVLQSEHPQFPSDISSDGRTMLVMELHPERGFDVLSIDLPTGTLKPLFETRFNESSPVFSPAGSHVAYVSDESGQDEIYLSSVSLDRRWQVSTDGGSEPRFSRNGGTLYFRALGGMFSVATELHDDPTFGEPRLLFEAPFDEAGGAFANYDVSAGERFLMVRTESGAFATELEFDLNYVGDIARRLPVR